MSPRVALCALLIALATGPALAQTGGLEVCAYDDAGRPLPGATATLSNVRQFTPTVALLTTVDGCVSFPVLRAGAGYLVEVSMPGFRNYKSGELRVPSGQTILQRAVLLPAITERVEVTGQVPLVDLDRTEGATRFDDEFIEHLPVPGRFYQNILTLAPGVLDEDGDGNPNVHGARERNFRAVIDGVANTDPLTGEWLSLINSDAIEEMEVVGTGAGVEFGRASGGFARIVQKQGSNDFEGLVSLIFRSSKLDGGSAGDLLASPESDDFSWLQPAMQVSGPIVKDRLWYRLSHEWIDREDPRNTTRGLLTTSRKQSIWSDQLTWQLSPRNKMSFVYSADPTTILNYGVDSRVPPDSGQRVERDGPTYRINWTSPVSPRLLVDSTVAYQDLERGFFPSAENVRNRCAEFGVFDHEPAILNTSRCFDATHGLYSGGHNETWEDRRQRLTVSTQATWFTDKIFGDSHRIKVGFVAENERFYRRLYRAPSITFEIEPGFLWAPDIGHSFVRVSVPPEANNSATGNNWAFYVEDQFKPVSNLSLTLGLRYDREEIFAHGDGVLHPAEEAEAFETTALQQVGGSVNIAALFARTFTVHQDIKQLQRDLATALGVGVDDIPLGPLAVQSAFWTNRRQIDTIEIVNNNFAPRFSLAWDPWGDGKTKFAVTAGRYYDKIFLAVPLIELEPPVAELEYQSIRFGDGFVNVGAAPLNPSLAIQTVRRDLRTPYQDEFTLSFEREIFNETMLRVSWIQREYRDQLQDFDINHVTGDKGRCVENFGLGQPVVELSFLSGQTIVDPYTGESYIDTDPGPGDGRLDDCTGRYVSGGLFGLDFARPDGLPDLYVLNPAWTEILEIGNYNMSDYEAWVVEVVRRLYRNWQMAVSYTWSEAVGAAEDFDQRLGNERNLLEQEFGFLEFDQTHVLKISAMTTTKGAWQLGGSLKYESGLPYSTLASQATLWSIPPLYQFNGTQARDFRFRYPTGRRNDGRGSPFWTLDLRIANEFLVKGDVHMRVTLEAFNVLDDQAFTRGDIINGNLIADRRFGRQFQVGLRVGF